LRYITDIAISASLSKHLFIRYIVVWTSMFCAHSFLDPLVIQVALYHACRNYQGDIRDQY